MFKFTNFFTQKNI